MVIYCKSDTPHPNNFCGCGFEDWLEVHLTPDCNANCSWCVERNGWHPEHRADWLTIAKAAQKVGRKNILLLGGEPTLYPGLKSLICWLNDKGHKVWITTNGSKLKYDWVLSNLSGIHGVNISIHHYCDYMNEDITGLDLYESNLYSSIKLLHKMGAVVRFNCNCINGYIDSEKEILNYIHWAKDMGANSVRFAELKLSEDEECQFVNLATILNHKYGTNDNPFNDGCTINTTIEGMLINFRQMCGLQNHFRPRPRVTNTPYHPVLYYDGKVYNGWQSKKKENAGMDKEKLRDTLQKVHMGLLPISDAMTIIEYNQANPNDGGCGQGQEGGSYSDSGGCRY